MEFNLDTMNNLAELLNSNQRGSELLKKVFYHCVHNKQSTIPEIANAIGCSVPAATKHVVELVKLGYVIDYGKSEYREGRPANMYGIITDSCFFIGVMVHYQSLNIGIMNLAGEIIKQSVDKNFRFANTSESLEEIVKLVKNFISSTCAENREINRSKILNVNFGIAGRVNPKTGYSFSMFNMGETPLNQYLHSKLNLNVTIDNDTRVMTYGEYADQNKYKPISHMLCLNVGYGVGMGIVIDGKIYEGKSGYAGEIGHLSTFDNEVICHCGKKGCLEGEASGQYLISELHRRIENGEISVLSKRIAENKEITIYHFIDAVMKREDLLCIEILERVGLNLGRQIANMINLFNPDKIVISGMLSVMGDYLLHPIKMSINKHALTLVSKDTEVVMSNLKMKAGILGSCLVARDKILNH